MGYEDDDRMPFVEPDAELNELTRAVIGAAIEVHRNWGPGLEEALYEDALCHEMTLRNIPFACQVWIDVVYKGVVLGRRRLDLVIADRIVVELKAVEQLMPMDRAQLLTYLKITGYRLGLLINFNSIVLKDGVKRVVNS